MQYILLGNNLKKLHLTGCAVSVDCRAEQQVGNFCHIALDCSSLSREDRHSQEQVLKRAIPINSWLWVGIFSSEERLKILVLSSLVKEKPESRTSLCKYV